MTKEELIIVQRAEKNSILQSILTSKKKNKLIVAGAGTGKTFTFSEVAKLNAGGTNIAMTFIRLLRNDMAISLGSCAEVRTFHEYCKKILHENRGGFLLYPKLTSIISEDAKCLEIECVNFDDKFQKLDETGSEISFYLKRGDYYNAVAFNDSVFRMLRELQKDPDIICTFDQIMIDEFQDFNPLEVAFINELEKKGNILIVGDDDQAVYNTRFSTPHHLREKYQSGKYEIFELPFCTRCTEVIVNATNAILGKAEANGNLKGRIAKRYECFIESKDVDNNKYPHITTGHITTMGTVLKFVRKRISEILPDEILDSWQKDKEYPTVLIVGKTQYLNPAFKYLSEEFTNITYKKSAKNEMTICDGYDYLSYNIKSNLGWRILMPFLLDEDEVKSIIAKTESRTPLIELLPEELVKKQTKIISIISRLNKEGENNDLIASELESLLEDSVLEEVKEYFLSVENTEEDVDKTKPLILLISYQGCKGMSAGFVFMIGTNNGIMPQSVGNITDVEICQFVVALTRTKKKCYILSEERMYGPKDKNKNLIPKNVRSVFIDWLPKELVDDLGRLKSEDI